MKLALNSTELFALCFLGSLVLTRVGVYLFVYYITHSLHQPPPETTLWGFRVHHYMYGIILILLGVAFKNVPLYAVGMGLFVDELTYLLMGGETHEDNYSLVSNLGTVVFALLVYFFRDKLLFFLD